MTQNLAISLDDKYTQTDGRVFMSSIQALVRLPLDQARRDREQGHATAGFISGYRGSPIGTYDAALWQAEAFLENCNIRFMPGLNEELAATAVRGSQELEWFGESRFQGVFSIWYGKGLGADRAHEAIKLGNLEGAAALGGVLAVFGDDHGGKSSVSSHQSEQVFIAASVPILYPSTTAEILEFGLFGWALSRYSGLYVGMKCVTDTLDLSTSVNLPDIHKPLVLPADFDYSTGELNLRPYQAQLVQESLVFNRRLPAAQAFVRANKLDRVVIDAPVRKLSIVSAGKAYLDVRQALDDLGMDLQRCAKIGLRVYKPGMIWPLDPVSAREALVGSREVLVVEEKRPVVEDQLATIFYSGGSDGPVLTGKRDPQGATLLPLTGELTPSLVREAIIRRLRALGLADERIEERAGYYKSIEEYTKTLPSGNLVRPAFSVQGARIAPAPRYRKAVRRWVQQDAMHYPHTFRIPKQCAR